jgi:hypothetical protein
LKSTTNKAQELQEFLGIKLLTIMVAEWLYLIREIYEKRIENKKQKQLLVSITMRLLFQLIRHPTVTIRQGLQQISLLIKSPVREPNSLLHLALCLQASDSINQ